MIFSFLKYIQPTLYFNCKINNSYFIFEEIHSDDHRIGNLLKEDVGYESVLAQNYDLSWQAINIGLINDSKKISRIEKVPLKDEYRFTKKYFHSVWAIYCLFIRILSLKNPIREIVAWRSVRNVNRVQIDNQSIHQKKWSDFQSKLLDDTPRISVIIPTLNRYNYLKKVLQDFEGQDYSNFEIIIVDQSDNFSFDFYKEFNLDIQLIRQEEKALWLARNTAIQNAKGIYIALSEDDVRIEKDWLSKHLKCIDFFKCDISAGVFHPEGSSIPKERMRFSIAKQFATGNALLKKEVFYETGLFDRQFEKQRMGDGEFGLRCFKLGFNSISNPFASCVDVKAPTGGLRELGSWDAFRPTNWFSPRPVPSVLYFYRRYFGNRLALFAMIKSIPPSIIPYKFKRNRFLLIAGFLLSILILPILIFQVVKSWRLASIKLKQGPIIESL